jgi:hypothetical protein
MLPGQTEIAELDKSFQIYQGSGSTTYTTTTTSTETTTATTVTTSPNGDNSVFFETNPAGAEIWLDGEDVGTSTFTFNTNRDGTYDVVVKKAGYEDYVAKLTIIRGQRVHFYAPLTQLVSNATAVTTTASATPGKNITTTTIQKSTRKMPTPLGTDDPSPSAEDSPADPALALGAAGIAIGLVLLRRR